MQSSVRWLRSFWPGSLALEDKDLTLLNLGQFYFGDLSLKRVVESPGADQTVIYDQ